MIDLYRHVIKIPLVINVITTQQLQENVVAESNARQHDRKDLWENVSESYQTQVTANNVPTITICHYNRGS